MTRDRLRNEDYFTSCIDFYSNWIEEDKIANIASSSGKAMNAVGLPSKAAKIIILRYGRGDAMIDIKQSVEQMIDLLRLKQSTLAALELEQDVREMYQRLDLSVLYEVLTLIAFMLALRFRAGDVIDVITLVSHDGEDALLDQIAHAVGGSGRKIAERSNFPRVYDALVDVIRGDASERSIKLGGYVQGWYKRMKPISWHDNHKAAEGAYFGYWCFEAALVAMLFEIDDRSFADHAHYPVDLVRHYRQTERPR